MNLNPINDYLLIRRQEKKLKSSILFIPSSAKEEDSCLGLVVSVGDKVEHFKPEEFVLYSVEAGVNHLSDPSLLFIKEKDCLLKVEKEKEES